ncbi:sigma-70 family RNA polymerase sigma factor [Bacillus salacetis]|uniref:Sigma-70 family RNA polymerase sigma factor n=1 Tax=Bacillus salacetis TaxID=2315464 RepID=A0A3A1QSQ6_9BACI|nr:sigma-70 family RNA polymerase sigma factor [Bacillus salacetis]RIW30427.1 sigma-70 family RNA polymerase sigma factor [Bacillus salacetis]
MKESIDDIYYAYFQDLYRFLLSLSHDHFTAEDLVQETFFRAHLRIEHYNGETIKSWLFSTAYHAYIDSYRKQKRMVIKEDSFFSKMFERKMPLLDTLVLKEDIDDVRNVLEHLPVKHKTAVLLHDFHGLSQREASEIMDVKPSHFKVLLFRGRQAVRNKRGLLDE